MNSCWIVRGLKIVLFAVVFLALFGFVVMSLWNWLMPGLFGWKLVSYWQALGLVILSKILFGGFRVRPGRRMYWRHRMMQRWEQMSPEERDKFREGLMGGCCNFKRPAAKPGA